MKSVLKKKKKMSNAWMKFGENFLKSTLKNFYVRQNFCL